MHIIKLPSQEIQIKWGMYAQRLYCERYNIPNPIAFFDQFADEKNIQNIIPQLLLIGAEYAAVKKGLEFTATLIDACEWCDEGGFDADGEIMKAFLYIIHGHKINLSEENVIANTDLEKKTES